MKKEVVGLDSREKLKSGKMEYLYRGSGEVSKWPLYGSLLRALGKDWKIGLVSDNEEEKRRIAVVESLLLEKGKLDIFGSEELSGVIGISPMDLVLVSGLSENATEKAASCFLGKNHVMVSGEMNLEWFDLISNFSDKKIGKGLLAITGNGKGKTTSALGKSLLAISEGRRVAVVQWFKEFKDGAYTWAINEHSFPGKLKDKKLIEFFPTGLGFFGSPNLDRVRGEEAYLKHRKKAYEGLELAKSLIESGNYSEVVLDELVDTVKEIAGNIEYPLIDLVDLQNFFEYCVSQRKTEVIVTGRRVTRDWDNYIGRSVVVTEVKHPWSSKGLGAVSGLDF